MERPEGQQNIIITNLKRNNIYINNFNHLPVRFHFCKGYKVARNNMVVHSIALRYGYWYTYSCMGMGLND